MGPTAQIKNENNYQLYLIESLLSIKRRVLVNFTEERGNFSLFCECCRLLPCSREERVEMRRGFGFFALPVSLRLTEVLV